MSAAQERLNLETHRIARAKLVGHGIDGDGGGRAGREDIACRLAQLLS